MKIITQTLLLSFVCALQFINAQVTTFIPDAGFDLWIDGDDMYYQKNSYEIFKADISNPLLPTTEMIFDADAPGFVANYGIMSLAVKDTNLYFVTLGLFAEEGYIYRMDLTDLETAPEQFSSSYAQVARDIDFLGAWMYTASAVNIYFRRYNTSAPSPVSHEVFLDKIINAVCINGYAMYFAENIEEGTAVDGRIYFKNMLLDLPEVLKFTAEGAISDLIIFEGMLYFTDSEGIKRIDPSSPSPTSELLISSEGYGNLNKMQIKTYETGENYMFATTYLPGGRQILKIDLNDETLSLKNNENLQDLHLYPNPFTNEIQFITDHKIESIAVYDMLGKSIYTAKDNLSRSFKVNTAQWSNGLYTVKVKTKNGYFTKKMVKE